MLKEPLIPTCLWTAFVNAANIKDDGTRINAVKGVIKELHRVNRDCVAFLIMHLQKYVFNVCCAGNRILFARNFKTWGLQNRAQ